MYSAPLEFARIRSPPARIRSPGRKAHHVGSQVDAEDGDGAQGEGDVGDDEEEEGGDLGDVAGQGVGDGLLEIVEDQTTCGGNRGVSLES